MLNFEENEDVLFKHKSLLKNEEGDIIVTNIRLLFMYYNNDRIGNNIILSWSNISDIKYSPVSDPKGRAIILLKTTINNSNEDIAIHLVHSSVEKKFAELERLKTITSQIRKKKIITSKKENIKPINQTNEKHKIDQLVVSNLDMNKRQKILESDKQLHKQYKDLVLISKVITEEDFWLAHDEVIQQMSHSDNYIHQNIIGNTSFQRKGKQNVLNLLDIIETSPDGEITSIDLSIDMKKDLFIMYPWLKRAFEAEVPLRKDETQFWTAYFQSEYYKTSSSSSSRNQYKGSNIYNNSTLDSQQYSNELLLRYGDEDDKRYSTSTTTIHHSGTTPQHLIQGNIHKKLKQLDHSDIDLTASYGDYRSKGENLDGEDERISHASNSNVVNPLIFKYNQTSMNVIKSEQHTNTNNKRNNTDDGMRNVVIDNSYTLKELERIQEIPFIELKYNVTSAIEPQYCDDSNHSNINTLDSSSNNSEKSLRLQAIVFLSSQLIDQQQYNDDRNVNKNDESKSKIDMKSLLEKQNRYFHTNSIRGNQLYVTLTNKLRKQTSLKQHVPHKGMNIHNNNNKNNNNNALLQGSHLLDDILKQELLEIYTDVTELLRHFYSVLNRCYNPNTMKTTSTSLVVNQDANITKAEAILERLKEHLEQNLENRKKQINEKKKVYLNKQFPTTTSTTQQQKDNDGMLKSLDASIAAINGIMIMIHRAQMSWNEMKV